MAAEAQEPRPARRWWPALVFAVAVMVSVVLLYRTLNRYDFAELVESVRAVPIPRLVMAICFAAASYFCLALNDWLAVHYVRQRISFPRTALASFTAVSLGHNIGFAALSSGAIRYRFYSQAGFSLEQVAKMIVFCGTTIFLGMFILADLTILIRPDLAEQITGFSRGSVRIMGSVLLLALVAYLAASLFVARPFRLFGRSITMPGPRLAMAQMLVGTVNFLFVAACLDATVSAAAEVEYLDVLSAYILANAAAIIVHSPGGLGVIETVVMTVLQRPEVIGGVLLFRFVYFLIPLAVGASLFAAIELRQGLAAPRQP